ncbi:MAG: hypothetical protein ACRD1G_00055, partial [Acidimicrobiales bacterium]
MIQGLSAGRPVALRRVAILALLLSVSGLFLPAATAASSPAALPVSSHFRPHTIASASTPGADWPGYLFGSAHSSYNPGATAITPSNAGQLAPAWKWLPPPSPNSATTSLLASPTVVNGVVYQGVKDGYVFAVSESNQQVLWFRFLAINT